jgi:hypothetical protein
VRISWNRSEKVNVTPEPVCDLFALILMCPVRFKQCNGYDRAGGSANDLRRAPDEIHSLPDLPDQELAG